MREDVLDWHQAVKDDLETDQEDGDTQAMRAGEVDERSQGRGHVGASGESSLKVQTDRGPVLFRPVELFLSGSSCNAGAMPVPLPLLGEPARERSDAARNREALLCAARRMVEAEGVDAVTMDALAEEAGVGKGTVFRRFESRAGLMAALVNDFEIDWQQAVLSGPPPLGPGAPPLDRLLAMGRSRMELNLTHAQLMEAAGWELTQGSAAHLFIAMHMRHLLGELDVRGDLQVIGTALVAPLAPAVIQQQVEHERLDLDRIHAGWADVVQRVVNG
jgi:AcrR family transcriptional regulator